MAMGTASFYQRGDGYLWQSSWLLEGILILEIIMTTSYQQRCRKRRILSNKKWNATL